MIEHCAEFLGGALAAAREDEHGEVELSCGARATMYGYGVGPI